MVSLSLHQIYTTQNNRLTIQLPDTFNAYTQFEVIILPIEDSPRPKTASTTDFIRRFAGAIPDFPEIERLEPQDYEAM